MPPTPTLLDGLRAGLEAGRSLSELLAELPLGEFELLNREWGIDGRRDQIPPEGDWLVWIISAIFLSESGERITRTIVGRQRG